MHLDRSRRRLVVAAASVVAAGCALKSPPTVSELQADALRNASIPPAWKSPGGTAARVADAWLTTFADPAL